jgi:hypothetical protein
MKIRLAVSTIVLSLGTSVSAHRLDEYLQATSISIEKDRLQLQMRLTPGVAVFPIVFASIDSDADGVISEAEQRAYAMRVVHDLALTMDGDPLRPRLLSARFPKIEEMKEGLGEIVLDIDVDLPQGGSNRRLVLENHHQGRIAAYLVNCLAPRDPDIRVTGQRRNYQQSFYQLDYVQAGARSSPLFSARYSTGAWLTVIALVLSTRLAWLWRLRGSTS